MIEIKTTATMNGRTFEPVRTEGLACCTICPLWEECSNDVFTKCASTLGTGMIWKEVEDDL